MVENHKYVTIFELESCFLAGNQSVIHWVVTEVNFHKHLKIEDINSHLVRRSSLFGTISVTQSSNWSP